MKRRVIDFLYNIDRADASLLGAPPQETISSQIGRLAAKGHGWAVFARKILDSIQPNHVEKAVQHADKLDAADNGQEG